MGDSSDGSSRAAQRARPDGSTPQKGMLGRLLAAISPQTDPTDEPHISNSGQNVTALGPVGLGNLRSKRVEDVAIPKVEITAIPSDISQDELVGVFRESGLTRLPVFDGTLDSPIGLVHLKDMALRHGFNDEETPFELEPMLRPLIFAPPSMPIGVLLQKMQTDRRHMALVIDEYGGVDGLVTIEDLIEQVIGEIEDEHDQEEGQTFTEEQPGCFTALARTPLDEFEAHIGMALADEEDMEEVDTLGGLVFRLTGRVPVRGEVVSHPSGAEIEVIDADPRRIKRLRVRLPHATAAE
jgi:magnesium and cobalt transporter